MSIKKHRALPPVLPFLVHVIRQFPLARWALVLTLLLLLLEYVGISVMIPLAATSGGGSGSGASATVILLWGQAVEMLGLPPTLMTWVWLFLVLLALRSAAGKYRAVSAGVCTGDSTLTPPKRRQLRTE